MASLFIVQKPLSLAGDFWRAERNDEAVIACLQRLVAPGHGVVAEAVRNATTSNYARTGALAGIPVLLGWENHERQCDAESLMAKSLARAPMDIRRLYSAPDFRHNARHHYAAWHYAHSLWAD